MSTTHTNGVHHATDETIDLLYAWMPPQAAPPAPLPEAAFSLTLKGLLDGQDAMLTVRGMTTAEFKTNLAAIRGLLDAPAAPRAPGSSPAPEAPPCPVHGVPMKLNHGKDGRTWHSHKTPDGWCKGR